MKESYLFRGDARPQKFNFRISISLLLVLLSGITIKSFGQQTVATTDSVIDARLSAVEKKVSSQTFGQSHFLVVGLTTFGFVSNRTITSVSGSAQTSKTSVMGGDTYEFSPMFLWRQGNRVLLEFEPSFNHDGLSVNWATVSYFAAPNFIVRGGYLVLPFGIYTKKLAAGWINKVATDPIGLPTGADYGVEISGGLPLGTVKWNYDLSITNGMSLLPNGSLQGVNLNSNARDKTFTGRLGLLPFSNNSLEIGVSGMHGGVANGDTRFQNAKVDMFAFDFNFVKNFNPFQINIKSQYNVVNVSRQNYQTPQDTTQFYTFSNRSTSGYGQFSIRPVESQSEFIKRIELAVRYGNSTTPANSAWGSNTTQTDYGINYWINWRTVLRLTYEILDNKSTANEAIGGNLAGTKSYAFHAQFSIQL